jgi:hypothetical protein
MNRWTLALFVVPAAALCGRAFAQNRPLPHHAATRAAEAVKPAAESKAPPAGAQVQPLKDSWDWPDAMQEVTKKFTGTQGVVLHIGDSITYSNAYGQWARYGKGQTPADKAILKWMHTNGNKDEDGWYLAAFDVPDRGGSYSAVSGMRLDQALAGGFHGIEPMADIIKKYNPQVVILMLGTNDASANRPVAAYRADLEKAVGLILANHTIPVLSTIPPHVRKQALAGQYNEAIVAVARRHKLPLIDFCGEILSRRPGMTWDGTLLNKNDVHPSAKAGDVTSSSEPTPQNLSKVGYLLRGWLSVQKIKEVKAKAIDPVVGQPDRTG